MRAAVSALAGFLLLSLPNVGLCGAFEDDVLAELNFARADPRAYARELGEAGRDPYGYEDPDAVDEAYDFLMRQRPLPPLRDNAKLAASARAHAASQAYSGRIGHGAPGSLGRRLQSQGVWAGISAEAISYGQGNPRDVVRQLIVDSGVPNRGHRHDIFSQAYQAAGVACGRHAAYGRMCVINYAGALAQR